MRATDLSFRVRSKLPFLAKRRYYDDTFLIGDTGSTILFIADAALVESKRGPMVRVKHDILEFPNERAMLGAVVTGHWKEAPLDGNPHWRPSQEMLEEAR